jgi:hypothetical protein
MQIRGKISEEEANRRRALLPAPPTPLVTPLGFAPIEELRSRIRHVPEVIDSPVEAQPARREAEEIGDATDAEQAFVDRLNESLR